MKLKKLLLLALVLVTLHVSASEYPSYLKMEGNRIIGCDKNTLPKNLVIPAGVTEIGHLAFYGCTSLTNVNIPDSVTKIGYSALEDCESLESITIPDSVTEIGAGAFEDCKSLKSVTISGSVTEIYGDTFKGCTSLKNITFGGTKAQWTYGLAGFKKIGNNVTVHCSDGEAERINKNAKNIVIPYGATKIAYKAFDGCTSLTSVNIPGSVTEIGDYAFDGCESLTSINIPDSVTEIGAGAFAGCKSLKSVNIPGSVTEIGDYAFDGCTSLTSVTIPGSVKVIGTCAFHNCFSLKSVTIPGSVKVIGNSAFHNCFSLKSVTIPGSVKVIGNSAFRECTSLTSITIPDSVKRIEREAFYGCKSLTSVNIPGSVTEIGYQAFEYGPSLKNIRFGGTKAQWTYILAGFNAVGNNVTVHCSDGNAERINENARKIVIPYGATRIAYKAFDGCTSLTSVTIPGSVKRIESEAFYGCTSLTSVTIPDSVTEIGFGAFEDCESLKSITFGGTKAQWTYGLAGFKKIGNNVTVHCSDGNAERINENARKIVIPSGVTAIGDYAFRYSDSLESVTIPGSVTEIGDGAFEDCKSLKSITIPDSVTEIGDGAFRECTSLTSITIPDSVTEIGGGAFDGCESLKDITFGGSKAQWNYELAGFNAVGDDVTVHCSDGNYERITKRWSIYIVIPSGVTKIGAGAFRDGYSLKDITFGGSKAQWTYELAGFNAVWGDVTVHCSDGEAERINKSSRKIVIPSGVTKIGAGAFQDCKSLESVTIPGSVTEIGAGAFQDCYSLETITFTGSREKLEKIKIGKDNENFHRANLSCAYETEVERLAEVERNERLMSTIIAKISKGEKNIKLKGSYSDEDLKSLNDAIAKANQKIDLDLSNAQKMPSLEWLTNFSNIEKVRLPKGLGKITVNLEEAKKIVPHPESKNIFAKDGLLYTNMGKTVYAVVEDAKSYTIPEGTKEIKASVFKDSGLESISLPKSLANIWEYAFEGCTNLKTVNYAGSKKAWKNIYINDDGKGNKLLHKAKFVYGEK